MKVIYLIRHANSEENNSHIKDIDRPLSQKGKEDAQLMALKLKELNVKPDLIVCSIAKRTISTKKIICKHIGILNTNIIMDSSIYEAPLDYLTFLVNRIPSRFNEVFLIGHNPAITLLSNFLTNDLIDYIPTCGVVKIEMDIEFWNEIVQGIGTKKYFIYPEVSL
jgi:phosphohistidine phosphatase